jgi:hypothetical protein
MDMDPSSIDKRLDTLEGAVATLEERVARLEPQSAPAAPMLVVPASGSVTDGLFSGLFVRMGAAVFALLGALILREATRQHVLAPGPGMAAGFAYCALLLVAPLIARRVRRLQGRARLLQYCGLSLAPLIILEMSARMRLGTEATAIMLAAVGLAGALAARLGNAVHLAGYGLLASLLAIASLGLGAEAVLPRAIVVLGQVAVTGVLAQRKGWGVLRPWFWPAGGLVLFLLALAMVRNPETHGATHGLAVVVLCAWAVMLASCTLRGRALSRGGALWLPLATLWAFGLGNLLAPSLCTPTALLAGLATLAVGLIRVWSVREAAAALDEGWVAMGIVLLALVLPGVDGTGISLAGLAILFGAAGVRARSRLLVGLAAVAVLEAAGRGIARLWLADVEDGAWLTLAGPGLALCALLLVQAAVVRASAPCDESRWSGRASSLSLVIAALVLAASLRSGIHVLVQAGQRRCLGETVALGALALLVAYAGRAVGNRALRVSGLIGVLALAVLVIGRDLSCLTGWRLLGSVVTMGTVFLVVSFTVRRSSTSTRSSSASDTGFSPSAGP